MNDKDNDPVIINLKDSASTGEKYLCSHCNTRLTTLPQEEMTGSHVCTKSNLEKVLQQVLKDKHKRYEDKIIDFLLNMKNRPILNDLTLYPC